MKILIAYDGSDFSNAILDDLHYAGLPRRAEVEVITFAEPEYSQVDNRTEGGVGWLSYRLIKARSSARFARDRIRADFPGWDVTFEARLAAPPQEIIRKVVEWNPDLVITGQHGRAGSKRAGLGRIIKRLFKETNCSLRIARAHIRSHDAPPRIIIPLSASHNLEDTARVITSRLWPPRTEVMLIASIGPILNEMRLACRTLDSQVGAVMEFQQVIERRLQSSNLLVTSEIRARFSANDVIETARRRRVDCVFIRAEKMSFIERMFCGDPVSSVAARAECSVEVVRGPVRCDAANYEFGVGAHHKDSLPIAS